MTKPRLTAVAVVLTVVVISGMIYLGIRLSDVQHTIQVGQKQQTHSRIATVQSRCYLTYLDLESAIRKDPVGVPGYRRVLAQCKQQLASVEAIDARTPNVK